MSRTQRDAVLAMPVTQDRDHIQGPADAATTLVEYGDYECPYSGAAYPIVKVVQTRMGERLRFVFRNFPIAAHPHAQRAAEAAQAAATQGRFDACSTRTSGPLMKSVHVESEQRAAVSSADRWRTR